MKSKILTATEIYKHIVNKPFFAKHVGSFTHEDFGNERRLIQVQDVKMEALLAKTDNLLREHNINLKTGFHKQHNDYIIYAPYCEEFIRVEKLILNRTYQFVITGVTFIKHHDCDFAVNVHVQAIEETE